MITSNLKRPSTLNRIAVSATRRLAAALAVAAFALPQLPAAAQEKTLVFATATSPRSPIALGPFTDWVKRINDEGAGVIKIDLRHGTTLANPANHYDRVQDGAVDITWGILTQVGGKFPRMSVLELPFLTEDTSLATIAPFSLALWRMYESGAFKEELKDIVPLFLTTFPQSTVHLRAPIPSLDDLGGKKVISGGEINSKVIEALGAVPLSINATASYEAVQRGVADGRLMPWTGLRAFRLEEVTSFHIEAPFGTAPAGVYISRRVWDSLTPKAKEIINKHSGLGQVRRMSEYQLKEAGEGRSTAAARGSQLVKPSTAQLTAWKQKTASMRADWAAKTPDGPKVLSAFESELAKALAEK